MSFPSTVFSYRVAGERAVYLPQVAAFIQELPHAPTLTRVDVISLHDLCALNIEDLRYYCNMVRSLETRFQVLVRGLKLVAVRALIFSRLHVPRLEGGRTSWLGWAVATKVMRLPYTHLLNIRRPMGVAHP